jgi:hypothetical protein
MLTKVSYPQPLSIEIVNLRLCFLLKTLDPALAPFQNARNVKVID